MGSNERSTILARRFRFEAAHRLPNVPPEHKCHRLHGHTRVTLHVTGELDETLGWIVDFADIDAAWRPLHALLDHRYLNEIEGLENPTSEVLAHFIFDRVRIPGAVLHAVTVHETCTGRCTVRRTPT